MYKLKERSPIYFLEDALSKSILNIAPEREDEYLTKIFENFSLEYTNDKEFKIKIDLKKKIIKLPIATLEYIWIFTYHSTVLYNEYRKAQINNESSFDYLLNKKLSVILYLLKWSLDNMLNSGEKSWLDINVNIKPEFENDDEILHTNNIFVVSIAWILVHEMHHDFLGHPPYEGAYSLLEEKEADLGATKWFLENISEIDNNFIKRSLGISNAILSIELYRKIIKKNKNNSHPKPIERLENNLGKYIKNDVLNAYITTLLLFIHYDDNLNVDNELEFYKIKDEVMLQIHRKDSFY